MRPENEGILAQLPPLVDAVKLENRLTVIEEGNKSVNANIDRLRDEMVAGFTKVTNRQDIANGRVNTLEAAERARAQREAIGEAKQAGAQQFKLGVKAKVGLGFAGLGALISVLGGLLGLLEKL